MKTIEVLQELFKESQLNFIGEIYRLQSPEFQENRGVYTNYNGDALIADDNFISVGAELISSRNQQNGSIIKKTETWNVVLRKRMLTAAETYIEPIINNKLVEVNLGQGQAKLLTLVTDGRRTDESTFIVNLEVTYNFNQDCLCC
jgi:hypothetical protein